MPPFSESYAGNLSSLRDEQIRSSLRIYVLILLKDYEAATTLCHIQQARHPTHPKFATLWASLLMIRQDIDAAGQILLPLIATCPNDDLVWQIYAQWSLARRDFDKALEAITRAIDLAPWKGRTYYALAKIHDRCNNAQAACAALRTMTKLLTGVHNYEFLISAALSLAHEENYAYSQAITIERISSGIFTVKEAEIYLNNCIKIGSKESAIDFARYMLCICPDTAHIVHSCAYIFHIYAIGDEAMFWANVACTLDPENNVHKQLYVVTHAAVSSHLLAPEIANMTLSLLDQDPGWTEGWLVRFQIEFSSRNYAMANYCMERYENWRDIHWVIRYNYGLSLFFIKKYNESLEVFRSICRWHEAPSPAPFINLANCYEALNRYENAISIYASLAMLIPPAFMSYLIACKIRYYKKMGDFAEVDRLTTQSMQYSHLSIPSIGEALAETNHSPSDEITEKNVESWHGACNISFFPRKFDSSIGIDALIKEYILSGFPSPPGYLFNSQSKILTMGSCFAQALRQHLSASGKLATNIAVPEGLNNTFALNSFIEWCLTNKDMSTDSWYDTNKDGVISIWKPDEERSFFRHKIAAINGFVITLGLAEVWRDRQTGSVFWRGVPESIYDETRHQIDISTTEENTNNIINIYNTIQGACGSIPVIFTLSPIPLNATFRGTSCMVADCASKSILRAALETVLIKKLPNMYYWPSFEIIRWLGSHYTQSIFQDPLTSGYLQEKHLDDLDARHIRPEFIAGIIRNFIEIFFEK